MPQVGTLKRLPKVLLETPRQFVSEGEPKPMDFTQALRLPPNPLTLNWKKGS